MPNFIENINIIETAIYGKEMRPAIKEALLQSRDMVEKLSSKADKLNSRLDALSGGGGDDGDEGGGAVVIETITPPIIVVYGASTQTGSVGIPIDA